MINFSRSNDHVTMGKGNPFFCNGHHRLSQGLRDQPHLPVVLLQRGQRPDAGRLLLRRFESANPRAPRSQQVSNCWPNPAASQRCFFRAPWYRFIAKRIKAAPYFGLGHDFVSSRRGEATKQSAATFPRDAPCLVRRHLKTSHSNTHGCTVSKGSNQKHGNMFLSFFLPDVLIFVPFVPSGFPSFFPDQ